MPLGNQTELRHDPGVVPPGVLLGRRVDSPPPKVDLSARTERVELGHERIREEEIEDLSQNVDALLKGFEGAQSLQKNARQVVEDFRAFAAEQSGKVDPTLPRTASLEGYKKILRDAKEKAMARVREHFDRFQEDFEG